MTSNDRRETGREEADILPVKFQVRKLVVSEGQVLEVDAWSGTDPERDIATRN